MFRSVQNVSRDRDWLGPVALIVAVHVLLCRLLVGTLPLFGYALLAYVGLAMVGVARFLWALWRMYRAGEQSPLRESLELVRRNARRILAVVAGVQLFAIGSGAFTTLKIAIPELVPFWADRPLTALETIGSVRPWQVTHALLGWATPAIDVVYASWLPVHAVAFYSVLASRPSPLKTQAVVSFALAWLMLGSLAAILFSSVGPIFYDRVFGAAQYGELMAALQDAPIASRTAAKLWAFHQSGAAALAMGISAMPSQHVAIALWMALVLKATRFAAVGWLYFALICLGSVHLGWHYASDSIAGAVGMLLIWRWAGGWAGSKAKRGASGGSSNGGLDDRPPAPLAIPPAPTGDRP